MKALSVTAPPASSLRSLSRACGISLDSYRADHVAKRVRRALERERVAHVEELAALLAADAGARTRFRRSVAVSVSGLFRDAGQFELLERVLLPPLLESGRRLTAWSAGCADGSELYSIAILLSRLDALDRALLLGSDLLAENLAAARAGVYGDVTIAPELRARTRWEQRDLVADPPPSAKWRLVLCRNLAIYLAPPAKQALHEKLAAALAVGGMLLLGRSERIAAPRDLGLESVAPHAYRRTT